MKEHNKWCIHHVDNSPLANTPLARGITFDLWAYVKWSTVYTTCDECLPKYLDHVRMLKLKQELLK